MKTLLCIFLASFSLSVLADDLCASCPTCGGCSQFTCPLSLNTNVYKWKNKGFNPYTGDPEYRNIAPSYAFNSAEMSTSAYAR